MSTVVDETIQDQPKAAVHKLPPKSESLSKRLYGDALNREPRIRPRPRKQHDISSLLRMLPYMRPYASRYLAMFLIAALGVVIGVVTPMVTRAIVDGPLPRRDHVGVIVLGLLAMTIGIVEAATQWSRRWIVSRATLGTETGIRLDLYAKLQRLPMNFHSHWESGQLLSRVMNDLGTVRRFLGFGMLFLIMNFIQIMVVLVLLMKMYAPLGIVVMLAVLPVAALCYWLQRRYMKISRRLQDETGDVASAVEEAVHGLRVVKAFGRNDHIYGRFDERATKLFRTSLDRVNLTAVFWTFLEIFPNITLIVVLGIGAVAAAQERITLGTLVAFITLLLSLVWPVSSLGFLMSMVQEAMTAADRVCEVFDAPNEIASGTGTLEHPEGHLTFENVAYRFPDADEDILHDVNLDIAPGETVALVGGTGSGKTTMTALVPRLVDVTAGCIRIDGVDIRDLTLPHLRSIVATAFEDPTLFSMSARENLTLGRPGASDQEIAQAIEVAQAQFVYDLPWGLDTRIGEQGMSLSGGQRQRLALARAVLTKPRILVLDDTLSALDIHTEALVEEALKRVLVGVTGIVVAHRASTVLLADRVAMIEGGTIKHVGTHAHLLATVPEYRDLLSAEFNAEAEMGFVSGSGDSGGDDDREPDSPVSPDSPPRSDPTPFELYGERA